MPKLKEVDDITKVDEMTKYFVALYLESEVAL
jgi:hypothetical protein